MLQNIEKMLNAKPTPSDAIGKAQRLKSSPGLMQRIWRTVVVPVLSSAPLGGPFGHVYLLFFFFARGRRKGINSAQTWCIVKGEAQKSPLFWRSLGGL